MAYGTNTTGPDALGGRLGLALLAGALLLVVLALLPFTIARRQAMRRPRGRARLDDRPIVLLLRSFGDDHWKPRSRNLSRAGVVERLCLRRRERFKEVLAAILGAYGPVEAVGEKDQRLPPPLGAVRRELNRVTWQQDISAWVTGARLVSVRLGRPGSLMWEIGELRRQGVLGKVASRCHR